MTQVLIYITAETEDEARAIAKALVEERLAACANVHGRMESFYWWEGAVQSDSETSMIAKTSAERVPALVARVKALHSYDCPCVVALPIVDGNADFLTWIDEETRPTAAQ